MKQQTAHPCAQGAQQAYHLMERADSGVGTFPGAQARDRWG